MDDVKGTEEVQEEPTTEEVVEDTDADTKDVEETTASEYAGIYDAISRVEAMLEKVIGGVESLRDAQSVMVADGATIVDDDEVPDSSEDGYYKIDELDLSVE